MKHSLLDNYTLIFPNRNPEKISAYAVGWISFAVLGGCLLFINIPAGIFTALLAGLALTGIMMGKNPDSFGIKNAKNVPRIICVYGFCVLLLPAISAAIYRQTSRRSYLAACIITAFAGAVLLARHFYHWYRQANSPELASRIEELKDSVDNEQLAAQKVLEELKQQQSDPGLQAQLTVKDRQIELAYRNVSEADHWATVPDCIETYLDLLEDDGKLDKRSRMTFPADTLRINIQKQLKSDHAATQRAKNSDFYRTLDIASAFVKVAEEYSTETLLREFNLFASPQNNLQRRKTKQ